MTDLEKPEQAPEDVAVPGPAAAPKPRQSLSKSRRELTEDELTQSGVRLMLLDELDRLDGEVARLNEYREKFHVADKSIATLEVKQKKALAMDVVHATCLSLGVGLLMLAPTLPSNILTWTAVAVGLVLVICGIVAKWIER